MDTRRKERKYLLMAEDLLKAAGADFVLRTRGSHGAFDLVASCKHWVKFIQLKAGRRPQISKADQEKILRCQTPNSAMREIWFWKDGSKLPTVYYVE